MADNPSFVGVTLSGLLVNPKPVSTSIALQYVFGPRGSRKMTDLLPRAAAVRHLSSLKSELFDQQQQLGGKQGWSSEEGGEGVGTGVWGGGEGGVGLSPEGYIACYM